MRGTKELTISAEVLAVLAENVSNALDPPLQIFFGPAAATVKYAGLAPGGIGVYQFNVVVPNVEAGDALPLTFALEALPVGKMLYTAVGN